MEDTSIQKAARKKDWALTQHAFRQFLSWLAEGNSRGEKYLEMRRRLVSYFDRKNCLSPAELADETLNRIARRLDEEGAITDTTPPRYCYIVAKFVFLEYLRRGERSQVSLDKLSDSEHPGRGLAAVREPDDPNENREKRLQCLECCSQKLDPDNRELIFQYYRGERGAKIENRKALAAGLGLTMNALSIRACRIRDRLEACVNQCCTEE
ncbi:MAG TPA: hypothetical protein VGL91_22605 [Acidobacteriota bacterium]|jgi:DNA-directed RNA polymerase specialized sigma24 family protein